MICFVLLVLKSFLGDILDDQQVETLDELISRYFKSIRISVEASPSARSSEVQL